MGKASRTKRERRQQGEFAVSLIACEGTWLERAPGEEEARKVGEARRVLQQHRSIASELAADYEAANRFSLELLRDERFQPLYFDDWVIEQVINKHGEPPVVESDDDPAFSDYLRSAVVEIASSRVRRAISAQATRFIPQLVEEGKFREALAIEYNIYLTMMSDAVTPLLAQMMVGGLARYYDELEGDEEDQQSDAAEPTAEPSVS